jgi:hypothetical protein
MQDKVSDEAHYWFTVQDFAYLSVHNGLDKMIEDVLQCRRKILADKQAKQVNHITDCEF